MPIWLKKAASLFSIFQIPRIPQHGKALKSKYRREVVRQTSNGNVLLQLGYYANADEVISSKNLIQPEKS